MKKLRPNERVFWSAVMIIGSSIYGVLVSLNQGIAQAIALGYIGVLLTIFIVCQVWRRS